MRHVSPGVQDIPKLVTIRLLQGCVVPNGACYNAGEEVGFPPDVAEDLVARGVARPAKAPDGPPADKMVGGAPAKK